MLFILLATNRVLGNTEKLVVKWPQTTQSVVWNEPVDYTLLVGQRQIVTFSNTSKIHVRVDGHPREPGSCFEVCVSWPATFPADVNIVRLSYDPFIARIGYTPTGVFISRANLVSTTAEFVVHVEDMLLCVVPYSVVPTVAVAFVYAVLGYVVILPWIQHYINH